MVFFELCFTVNVITEITAIRRFCASNIMSNRTILIISLNIIYMCICEFGHARVCFCVYVCVPTWQELSLHIAWRYSVVSGALGNRHEIRFIKETLHFFLECSCSTAIIAKRLSRNIFGCHVCGCANSGRFVISGRSVRISCIYRYKYDKSRGTFKVIFFWY